MVYASATELAKHYAALSDSVSSNLQGLAVTVSDAWVNSQIEGISQTSVPDPVVQAATLYAYSFILRNLYDTDVDDTFSATWYENLATKILSGYIAHTANENSELHPYSSSQSPTNVYSKRNKRTVIDDEDYDYVDENTWPSER